MAGENPKELEISEGANLGIQRKSPQLLSLKSTGCLKLIDRKDLQYNFMSAGLLSGIGMLPVKFGRRSGLVSLEISRKQACVNYGVKALCFLHLALSLFRLGQFLTENYQDDGKMDHLPCPVACLVGSIMSQYLDWYILKYEVGSFKGLFNLIVELFPDGQERTPLLNLQTLDAILIFLWALLAGAPFLHVVLYLAQPNGFNFIYSNIPEQGNSTDMVLFIVCAFTEFLLVSIWMTIVFVMTLTLMPAYSLVEAYLHGCVFAVRARSCFQKSSYRRILGSCRCVRELQIFMQHLNGVARTPLWMSKQALLLVAIVLGFFAVRLIGKGQYVLGLVYMGLFLTFAGIFPVMTVRATRIPAAVDAFKTAVRAESQKLTTFERKYVMKMLDSMRNIEVQVGSFYGIGPFSNLEIIEFIIFQVSDLLVMYGK